MPPIPLSQFRRNLFALVEAAMKGERVSFIPKGVRFRLVPEIETDRLSRLTPLQVLNPRYQDLDDPKTLQQEMEAAWEEDWSNL